MTATTETATAIGRRTKIEAGAESETGKTATATATATGTGTGTTTETGIDTATGITTASAIGIDTATATDASATEALWASHGHACRRGGVRTAVNLWVARIPIAAAHSKWTSQGMSRWLADEVACASCSSWSAHSRGS
jgi:hypothetical protein